MILNPNNFRVRIVAPVLAVLDEIETTIGTQFQVHGPLEGRRRHEAFHHPLAVGSLGDVIVLIQLHSDDPVSGPFIDEEGVIELFG